MEGSCEALAIMSCVLRGSMKLSICFEVFTCSHDICDVEWVWNFVIWSSDFEVDAGWVCETQLIGA